MSRLAPRIEKALTAAREQRRADWAKRLEPELIIAHRWLVDWGVLEPLPAAQERELRQIIAQQNSQMDIWLDGTALEHQPLRRFQERVSALPDDALDCTPLPLMWSYLKEVELLFGRPGCRARFLDQAMAKMRIFDEARLIGLMESQTAGVPDGWLDFIEEMEVAGVWKTEEETK